MSMRAREKLRERGYSIAGLARAHGLSLPHFKNALWGRTPFTYPELFALTDALQEPITEIVPEDALRKAMR